MWSGLDKCFADFLSDLVAVSVSASSKIKFMKVLILHFCFTMVVMATNYLFICE